MNKIVQRQIKSLPKITVSWIAWNKKITKNLKFRCKKNPRTKHLAKRNQRTHLKCKLPIYSPQYSQIGKHISFIPALQHNKNIIQYSLEHVTKFFFVFQQNVGPVHIFSLQFTDFCSVFTCCGQR